jgi:hypothetical protein
MLKETQEEIWVLEMSCKTRIHMGSELADARRSRIAH